MKINTAKNWLLYTGIFYGLCGFALLLETFCWLSIPFSFTLTGGISITIVLYYNIPTVLLYCQKQPKSNNILDSKTLWLLSHKRNVVAILFCLVLLLFFLLFHQKDKWLYIPFKEKIFLGLVLLLSTLYYCPLERYCIRNYTFLKPLYIGFYWSITVVILPALLSNYCLWYPNIFFLWLGNFVFIAFLAILFDVKDYEADKKSHCITFIVHYGLETTKIKILYPLLLFFTIIEIFRYTYFTQSISVIITVLIFCYLIWRELPKALGSASLDYFLIVIDGFMLLKALLSLLIWYWTNIL